MSVDLMHAADGMRLRLMLERSRLTAVAEAAAARANKLSLNKQVCVDCRLGCGRVKFMCALGIAQAWGPCDWPECAAAANLLSDFVFRTHDVPVCCCRSCKKASRSSRRGLLP